MLYNHLKPSQFVGPKLNPPYIWKRKAVSSETAETIPTLPPLVGCI